MCKVGSRFAALDPIAQGLERLYGSLEREGTGGDNPFVDAKFDQRRVVLKRGTEVALAWKKHEHELGGRLELVPVLLAAQLDDVLSQLTRMVLQSCRPHRFGGGLDRLPVGDVRHFGVDDNIPPPGSLMTRSGMKRPSSDDAAFFSTKWQ